MLVAMDTATDTASLALVQDSVVLAELTWRCGQNHTTQLTPNLSHLLRQTGLSLKSAVGIIVARGPGSYNGLRVGISTAKGLAFSLDIPILGISTLEAEAYPHAGTGLPVCPILNAGRGEIAAALYQQRGDQWRQLTAEHITTVEALCSGITGETVFCGEFMPAVSAELVQRLGRKAIIPSAAAGLRRAGFLAELGLRRWRDSEFDDPATLQPLYLRGPSITKAKHR
ncbi:MAG: tRNA (adenosine(37)-N6)-threonylcarbamoyltransferase complex dimerization subunit type 1 TsaB [Dehalococcoidales bacterium]|nr:tRNA (adenosine(37)-N6)-threonylcarbamoyltransferase complex dimerization subunit type 1 TsaB [Dehalococcoidales bacterium]